MGSDRRRGGARGTQSHGPGLSTWAHVGSKPRYAPRWTVVDARLVGEQDSIKASRRKWRRVIWPFGVVFLAGMAVGFLGLSVWVTPVLSLSGNPHSVANTAMEAACNGWPQWSFDGYFRCSVQFSCVRDTNEDVFQVTAPGVTNLLLSALPLFDCNGRTAATMQISGQLGYSGTVAISVEMA